MGVKVNDEDGDNDAVTGAAAVIATVAEAVAAIAEVL